jgi:hypothetical protein
MKGFAIWLGLVPNGPEGRRCVLPAGNPWLQQHSHQRRLCGRQSGGFEQLAAWLTCATLLTET